MRIRVTIYVLIVAILAIAGHFKHALSLDGQAQAQAMSAAPQTHAQAR